MENITLAEIVVAIGMIGTIITGIFKVAKPIVNLDKRITKIEEHQDNDNKRLAKLESDTKQILLSVSTLLSHSIDNNHIDKLKQRKNEMDEYLINR